MAPPRVLLLGGHGKVSLLMTPLMLARSWHVTSLIRNPDHAAEIQAAGKGQPGKLDVLVRSLDDVQTEQQAKDILQEANPNWVVWSAGAGGQGGPSRTYAVDRDAAIAFISASARTPSVSKFLMVSYIGSRRARAPWWTDQEWEATQAVNNGVLKHYHVAKLAADQKLAEVAKERGSGFQGICFRPGTLAEGERTGKVSLGKIRARGSVTRADVADVAVRLLERGDTGGWYDLLEGEEETDVAVERVVSHKVDCMEGEDGAG